MKHCVNISRLCAIHRLATWRTLLFSMRDILSVLKEVFINFYMAWNKGINFGLFEGDSAIQAYILAGISIVISIVFYIWLRNSTSFLMQILASLVIGGALGNAIDRFLYGAVADFINVTCCEIRNPYSFNLADVFIFVGLIGLLIFKFEEKHN